MKPRRPSWQKDSQCYFLFCLFVFAFLFSFVMNGNSEIRSPKIKLIIKNIEVNKLNDDNLKKIFWHLIFFFVVFFRSSK